jgi:glycosyltransferase involved in cell wall biosynthesis
MSLLKNEGKSCYTIHSPVSLEMRAEGRDQSPAIRARLSLTSWLAKNIEAKCIRDSDYVIAHSEYTRTLIHKIHGGAYSSKIIRVPGWVDLARFKVCDDRERLKSRLGWPLDRPVLFTLRRLVSRTGIDRLLRAIRLVRARGYRFNLMIGGSGPLRARLEHIAHELAVEDCAHFIGHVADAALPDMYAAADAFVLPTAELECFGLIALEALACGRPVLATPVGAIPEILEPIEPRWMCKDTSAEAIAASITAFIRGELPEHNPKELRQEIAKSYSEERLIKKMTDIYLAGIQAGA